MLRAIEFMDKRFEKKKDYNLFIPISKNCIILCKNYKLMDSLAKEILNTVNGNAEYNDYDCDDEDVGNAGIWLSFGLQRLIDINGQRITLSLEPAIIYKADDIGDVWMIDQKSDKKEIIYPLNIFKGSKQDWDNSRDEIYKTICAGGYGTYDGSWVKLERI